MTTRAHPRPQLEAELATQLGGLVAWHPLRWLGWLALSVMAVPVTRMIIDAGHFVPGGLAIETDGASGEIGDGRYHLALPMRVYNGTNRVITNVSLWVEGYACPAEGAKLQSCTRFISFEQSVPMNTSPKTSGWYQQEVSGGLPQFVAGGSLRILRRVQSVDDVPADADGAAAGQADTIPDYHAPP